MSDKRSVSRGRTAENNLVCLTFPVFALPSSLHFSSNPLGEVALGIFVLPLEVSAVRTGPMVLMISLALEDASNL
jgi:hypothetical protein